jgi:hypothetical protein
LRPARYNLAADKKWSWRVILGAKRDENERMPPFLRFAAGKSVSPYPTLLNYAMVTSTLSTSDTTSAIGGLLGVSFRHNQLRFNTEIEKKWNADQQDLVSTKLSMTIPLAPSFNWTIKYNKDSLEELQTGLNFHF